MPETLSSQVDDTMHTAKGPEGEAPIANGASAGVNDSPVARSVSDVPLNMLNGDKEKISDANVQKNDDSARTSRPQSFVQTRKRSRSGTRIRRPLPEGNHGRRRGSNDTDGRAVEKIKLQNYVNGDHEHYLALLHQDNNVINTIRSHRKERLLNLRLRGVTVDERSEQSQEQSTDGYEVRPLTNPAMVYGPGYGQYGTVAHGGAHRPPSGGTMILNSAQKPRVGGRKARNLRTPRRELAKHSEQPEELVPIRLDLEWEKVRLRDTFTWNLHDRVTPIDVFAEHIVEDFGLSLENCRGLVQQVIAHIEEQIQDYMPHIFIDDGPDDPHSPYIAYKDDEMRITVKLNITIGQHTLVDQFEWDINNAGDAPELFAKQMTRDLCLSGEFATAIAHDIREQSQLFTKSLYIIGHPFDGRPVGDQDLQAGMMPSPLPSSFRPYQATKEFVPYLYELNEADLERTELSLSREERRQKRSVNRRGGPALPDLKDRRKTIRTLVVSSIIPGAAETLEDSRVFKRVVTATGKSKRPGYRDRDSLEASDASESDDSAPASPVIPQHLLSGTARTRGMRGAASAAQAALRGALARSATPESLNIHHHETRTGRRRDYREDSVEDTAPSLIVKFKIAPVRLKQLMRDLRQRSKVAHDSPRKDATGHGTPKLGNMGPPSTPGQRLSQHRSSPHPHPERDVNPVHPHAAQLGRVDAKAPPSDEHPPPPCPEWLLHALRRLRQTHPNDRFEATMRYMAVSKETDLPLQNQDKPSSQLAPDSVKYMYYPRIRCLDCPQKLYTPGPETGVTNFEVHLKNRGHIQRVEERLKKNDDESS